MLSEHAMKKKKRKKNTRIPLPRYETSHDLQIKTKQNKTTTTAAAIKTNKNASDKLG